MSVPPQRPSASTSPRKKGFPPGLAIAIGLILGVGAGVAAGHLLLFGVGGVLLGGIVDLLNAWMRRRPA